MMDFKNSAMKLFSNEEPIDIYTGPYVVRPGELDILVRTPHTYEDAVSYADKLIEECQHFQGQRYHHDVCACPGRG